MAGLMDFLQSASNSAASNVSAPVDGLAWLLRKAGVPMPQNPLLGSDWMAEKGLTKPVAQSGASLMGETAGMLAPFLAAAKAPQIAKGLLQGADNLAAPQALSKQAGKVFVYPQDKALATAQANAAKSLDEGGLGLAANNTPAQRAQAMGFDMDVYHATKADIPAFDMGRVKERFPYSFGIHTTTLPSEASVYAQKSAANLEPMAGANILPLKARPGHALNIETKMPSASMEADINRYQIMQELVDAKKAGKPFDSVVIGRNRGDEWDGANYITRNPENLRSRFAAFDPARRNEADVLGRADPALLGLLGLGVGSGAAYYNGDK